MTATTYAWPRPNILKNGGFDGALTSWSAVGSTVYSAAQNHGTFTGAGSANLTGNADGLVQTVTIRVFDTITDPGRWISLYWPHHWEFWAKVTSGSPRILVTLALLDDTSAVKYGYNWFTGKWETKTTEATCKSWDACYQGANWERFILPKVAALLPVDTGITDSWRPRIRFTQASAGTVFLDDILFTQWPGNVRADRLGPYAVFSNGLDYPVKWDPRSGTVTELALPSPYEHTALPTVTTATTGGTIPNAHYVGFFYNFKSLDTGESGGAPIGIQASSGMFHQQVGSSANTNTITVDFSALVLPNSQIAKTTDYAQIDRVVLWRTINSSDLDTVKNAMAAGLFFYQGEAAPGSTLTVTSNAPTATVDLTPEPFYQFAPPGGRYLRVYRNRLFVAGPSSYELGKVSVTNASRIVTGITDGNATLAPTRWNRTIEMMLFEVDGDTEKHLIERYVYPEDDGGGSADRAYLSETYRGTSGTVGYKVVPRGGRAWYSEENRPWAASPASFIVMDGGEGLDVTGIGYAGPYLLLWTPNQTFAATWNVNPMTESQQAAPISRDKGCISHDSFACIDGTAYWLSDRGVVSYRAGMAEPEIISAPIHRIFTDPEDPDYMVRDGVTLLAEDAQGVHFSANQQYLLAIKTKNSKGACDVVLAWNYFLETWDILRLRTELTRWNPAKDDAGNEVLLFTDAWGSIWQWDTGYTDGAGSVNYAGTLRGIVTSAAANTLTDTGAAFYQNSSDPTFSTNVLNLDGAYVKILAGTGAGQIRRIENNSATVLRVAEVWDINPSTNSVYEIAGVDFTWKSKFSNMGLYGHIKRLKWISVDHKRETWISFPEVHAYREFRQETVQDERALAERSFSTGEDARSRVGLEDAAGYNLAVAIQDDGPESPLEIRAISLDYTVGDGK